MKLTRLTPLLIFSLLLATACKKKDDPADNGQNYTVPTTYNFENVSYSGQTTRLNMLEEMVTYMKTANTSGTTLDAQKLKDMFANQNNAFSDPNLNTADKQLKSKTFELDQAKFEGYMDNIAQASTSTEAGKNGVAGVVVSNDGAKKYLFDANGFEYTQLIEKGLMGATFYYQIAEVYTRDSKIGPTVNNTDVTPGKGTDMEHHWDEAFGYYGVPVDFPANKNGIRFIGKYSNSMDGMLGTNKLAMDAFLKGRAAISNDDMTAKDEAADEVRQAIEKIFAGTAIHYLNGAKQDFADDALRNHQLSEFLAFFGGLKYNSDKMITDAQMTEVLGYVGTNLYEVTVENITKARDKISQIYELDDVKDIL